MIAKRELGKAKPGSEEAKQWSLKLSDIHMKVANFLCTNEDYAKAVEECSMACNLR